MGESEDLTVTCKPDGNGSKPVHTVIITDSMGNQYEYDVPQWMQDLPREHLKERAKQWHRNELETFSTSSKQIVQRGTLCSTKLA